VFSTTANLRGAMAFETIELAHNGFEMTTS
jgi:hypothetical protein